MRTRNENVVKTITREPWWTQRLYLEKKIWNIQKLGGYISKYPIQLNLHVDQNCCPSDNVMESFRMALVLSTRACVLSAAVHPLDAEDWQGIVHFFQDLTEAETVYQKVRRDVPGCQAATYANYKSRFDSSRIMQQSRFIDMWREGGYGQNR